MLTNKQLVNWFSLIEAILGDLVLAIENLQRFSDPRNDKEKQILSNTFFTDYHRHLRFTVIVQLCKLLVDNENQKLNFHKLFNTLKYEKYDSTLKSVLKANRGQEGKFINKLNLKEGVELLLQEVYDNKDRIERIKTLRDRSYAHTDPKKQVPDVTDCDLTELVQLSVRIYDTLNNGIYQHRFVFSSKDERSIDHILNALRT